MTRHKILFCMLIIGSFLMGPSLRAQESADIGQFKKLLARQSKQLETQQKMLDDQNRQLTELQSRLDNMANGKPESSMGKSDRKKSKTQKPVNTDQPPALANNQPIEAEPSKLHKHNQTEPSKPRLKEMPKDTRPPEIPRVSADVGGVLTPKGRFVIEPQLQYAYSKSQRVALAGYTVGGGLHIGIADVRDVKRETETVALTGRYGVTNRFELEAKIPYTRREDTSQARSIVNPTATDKFFNADGMDIGDIEIAGHYQINDGSKGWPFFIGNLRIKTDTGTSPYDMPFDADYFLPTKLHTGTGFWSFQPSLTLIFPTDPAVFYANINYLWNVGANVPNRVFQYRIRGANDNLEYRNVKSGGKIDPGDSMGVSFGTSLAYNEKASFSLGYSHSIYFKTEQDGEKTEGTDYDIGQFTFGLNYAFSKKTSANLAVAIGATRDAPDVQMTLRVPVGFDVF